MGRQTEPGLSWPCPFYRSEAQQQAEARSTKIVFVRRNFSVELSLATYRVHFGKWLVKRSNTTLEPKFKCKKWKIHTNIFFVYVNIFKRTHGPYVNISKHFADHLPTPNCKRNLWRLPNWILEEKTWKFKFQKWTFFDHLWSFFWQLYRYLPQNWDSEGHFEVLSVSNLSKAMTLLFIKMIFFMPENASFQG